MQVTDIIAKKRDGKVLCEEEINYLITGYVTNEIPEYQMAAWLMAVYMKGMTMEETAALTMAMANSGDLVDLHSIYGVKVDKHSTGGVADTTTLILVPLVAAAGVPVAKMSGRGLGFTGGTIDKLESISGFQTALSKQQFLANIKQYGLAITSQSPEIAPADGKMYALRDVTATVESIPLIASSIMSKKIAAGADKILLDVKVGKGAFMNNIDDALQLAETMVNIGCSVGRETCAVLSNMDEPLGNAIGNSLEVQEAFDVLNGKGPQELRHVCLTLGSYMLKMAGLVDREAVGYTRLQQLLDDKTALAKFENLITAQGGDASVVYKHYLLPQAAYAIEIKSEKSGFVTAIDAGVVGRAAMLLGAGRERKNQSIDLAAGITLKCRIGNYLTRGQLLAVLYSNKYDHVETAKNMIVEAINLGENQPAIPPTLIGYVDKKGYRKF